MDKLPPTKLRAVILDCRDIAALANFYAKMLGWKRGVSIEHYAEIESPDGGARIGFQKNDDYTPPIWPEEPPGQQMMAHLDFEVAGASEMEEAVRRAIECGATKAKAQFGDHWTTMIDPEGHPFCFKG